MAVVHKLTNCVSSLRLGLGERPLTLLDPSWDRSLGSDAGRQVFLSPVRVTIRGGCTGSAFVYLQYERDEGEWGVLHM